MKSRSAAMTKSERDRRRLADPFNRARATAIAKAWRDRNPEKVRAAVKKWNASNVDRVIQINKDWVESNPDSIKAAAKRFRDKNKKRLATYNRAYDLKHKYGISVADYESMRAAQCGRCAICGDEKRLSVDHCHSTGVVRGLLCSSCNLGLGRFYDSPDRLKNAAEYLGMARVVEAKSA